MCALLGNVVILSRREDGTGLLRFRVVGPLCGCCVVVRAVAGYQVQPVPTPLGPRARGARGCCRPRGNETWQKPAGMGAPGGIKPAAGNPRPPPQGRDVERSGRVAFLGEGATLDPGTGDAWGTAGVNHKKHAKSGNDAKEAGGLPLCNVGECAHHTGARPPDAAPTATRSTGHEPAAHRDIPHRSRLDR
jgi:hypothetical protein